MCQQQMHQIHLSMYTERLVYYSLGGRNEKNESNEEVARGHHRFHRAQRSISWLDHSETLTVRIKEAMVEGIPVGKIVRVHIHM